MKVAGYLLIIAAAGCLVAAFLSCAPPPLADQPWMPADQPAAELGEAEVLEYEVSNAPAGAVFDPAARTFSWQTQPGDAGIYPGVCFSVTDPGGLSDEECINIIVLDDNSPPTLQEIPLKVVDLGGVVSITLQSGDPDGDEIQYLAMNLPPGAIFDPPVFSWFPEDVGVWPGLIFGVTDGKEKTLQKAVIAVRNG